MATIRGLLLFLCTLFLPITGLGQLSDEARISVITCGPGEQLYSKFGHSAFRVTDPAAGIDVVYNYGTFDFTAPGFYTSFAKGQLLYFLSRSRYKDFLYAYQLEGRWVKEQVLDLPDAEKNAVFEFLEWNYLPENRFYRYDFLQENCSTKIPDVLKTVLEDDLYLDPSYLEQDVSFRTLIQQYLRTNRWGSFGIDLALGSVIDQPAGPVGHLFLPDYVYEQMKTATFSSTPLVEKDRLLLNPVDHASASVFFLSPGFWIGFLCTLGILATFRKKWFLLPLPSMDNSLFLVTGLLGLLITFLWWFTDHTATQWNFNILWAFPLNLILLFPNRVLPGKNTFKKWAFAILLLLLVCAAGLWVFGVQIFHPLIVPIWMLLGLRYSVLYRYFCSIE